MSFRLLFALALLTLAVADQFSPVPWVAIIPAFAAGVFVAWHVQTRASR